MTVLTNAPVHTKASWRMPFFSKGTVADPPKYPIVMFLRSSCGHILGFGYVWKRQRFLLWKSCR